MFTFTPASLLTLALAAASALAAPLEKRIVVAPHITSPVASTVWAAGSQATVTWDTSAIPAGEQVFGMLVLGHLSGDSENLDLDNPLAANVSLNAGSTKITVPSVASRTDYIVVLFGDSGNTSPKFTITSDGAAAGSAATTLPALTSSLLGAPGPVSRTLTGTTPGGPLSSVATATSTASAISSTTPGGPLSSAASAASSAASALSSSAAALSSSVSASSTSASASSPSATPSATAPGSTAGSGAPRTGASALALLAGAAAALALCL